MLLQSNNLRQSYAQQEILFWRQRMVNNYLLHLLSSTLFLEVKKVWLKLDTE
jgi:hypothetical protein